MEIAQDSLKTIKNSLLPQLNVYGLYAGSAIGGPANPFCSLGPDQCSTIFQPISRSTLQNTFNYTAPEYQVGFSAEHCHPPQPDREGRPVPRGAGISAEPADLRSSRRRTSASTCATRNMLSNRRGRELTRSRRRAIWRRRHLISQNRNSSWDRSRAYDTLTADHDLAVAESALFRRRRFYEKAKVDIDRATGDTLDRMDVSIDDAKSGVVTRSALGCC